jgi:hypothetical protein
VNLVAAILKQLDQLCPLAVAIPAREPWLSSGKPHKVALVAAMRKLLWKGRIDRTEFKQVRARTRLLRPKLYLPYLFFQLIARRYERGSMILASNLTFDNWRSASLAY